MNLKKKNERPEIKEPVSRIVAKERLKRTIRSERLKMPEDVMVMMQSDLKALIERYLGENAKDTDLVLEVVHKPGFTTSIPWQSSDIDSKKS